MSKRTGQQLRVTLVRSLIGRLRNHRECAKGLGLRRIHQSAIVEDSACTRGMIRKVAYLVKCEEI